MIQNLYRVEFNRDAKNQKVIDTAKQLFPEEKIDDSFGFALIRVTQSEIDAFTQLAEVTPTKVHLLRG